MLCALETNSNSRFKQACEIMLLNYTKHRISHGQQTWQNSKLSRESSTHNVTWRMGHVFL